MQGVALSACGGTPTTFIMENYIIFFTSIKNLTRLRNGQAGFENLSGLNFKPVESEEGFYFIKTIFLVSL
jgi:hypothetical protein